MADWRKMVKEEKKIKEEKKLKKEMNKTFLEFSPWGHIVDYHEQIIEYFVIIRELPSTSLNPKFRITNEHVTVFNIAKVFGLDCSSFKTINLTCM